MEPLFSKVDLNKLWHDIQNEETLICAKFGKDLFNISKVVGRKKVAQFFDSQCIYIPRGEGVYSIPTKSCLQRFKVKSSAVGKCVLNNLHRTVDLWDKQSRRHIYGCLATFWVNLLGHGQSCMGGGVTGYSNFYTRTYLLTYFICMKTELRNDV